MRFVLTSSEFVYGMRPRPGFPLILNDEMEPAGPFHNYLTWRLLGKGAALDQKTWEAYGRAIWDFARFLQANNLTWNQPFTAPGEGVVAMYRDWQVTDLKLDAGTINQRLRQVVELYEWAQGKGLIGELTPAYNRVKEGLRLTHAQEKELSSTQGRKIPRRWSTAASDDSAARWAWDGGRSTFIRCGHRLGQDART